MDNRIDVRAICALSLTVQEWLPGSAPEHSRFDRSARAGNQRIDLYFAVLDKFDSVSDRLASVLSVEENRRAGLFAWPACREFIYGRGILREILANRVGISPASLVLGYTSTGKPELTRGPGDRDVRFNLSHSDGLVLYAFADGHEIGVDLERFRSGFDFDSIARSYFRPIEIWELERLHEPERSEFFYQVWARTEARVKATGLGLGCFPRTSHGFVADFNQWPVIDLKVWSGYAAAVCWEPGLGVSRKSVAADRNL